MNDLDRDLRNNQFSGVIPEKLLRLDFAKFDRVNIGKALY